MSEEYVLSCSYGKDSLACIGACAELGWRIDRIVHAEVWATDTIPADLPPMVEFKKKADRIIKERWGIEVEHVCAVNRSFQLPPVGGGQTNKLTYERYFYHILRKGKHRGEIKGFPQTIGGWCQNLKHGSYVKKDLRANLLQNEQEQWENKWLPDAQRELVHKRTEENSPKFSPTSESEVVQYLGIASDEPERIARHKDKPGILLPLVEIGWTEAQAKQWCIDNDLLSPIYTDECTRGGCWFCHNQGVNQLRLLRKNYPDLWALLMKWDNDSPVTFHADGHTVHDFDRRFEAEDKGFISKDARFHWADLDNQQYNIYHYFSNDGTLRSGYLQEEGGTE